MVALARNLDLIGSRFLTGLTAVFVTRLHRAPARQVRTLLLLVCRHHCSPLLFSFSNRHLHDCGGIIVACAISNSPDSRAAFRLRPLSGSDLSSFHHPANQCSRGDAYRKRRRKRQHRVTLDALSCVIQEFLGSIAALFCGTPHYSHAIFYRIGDSAGCTRSPVS
jgi:hypothetical protein